MGKGINHQPTIEQLKQDQVWLKKHKVYLFTEHWQFTVDFQLSKSVQLSCKAEMNQLHPWTLPSAAPHPS
jgi:hypothetical protein